MEGGGGKDEAGHGPVQEACWCAAGSSCTQVGGKLHAMRETHAMRKMHKIEPWN
jgi:hypothetical protein